MARIGEGTELMADPSMSLLPERSSESKLHPLDNAAPYGAAELAAFMLPGARGIHHTSRKRPWEER